MKEAARKMPQQIWEADCDWLNHTAQQTLSMGACMRWGQLSSVSAYPFYINEKG